MENTGFTTTENIVHLLVFVFWNHRNTLAELAETTLSGLYDNSGKYPDPVYLILRDDGDYCYGVTVGHDCYGLCIESEFRMGSEYYKDFTASGADVFSKEEVSVYLNKYNEEYQISKKIKKIKKFDIHFAGTE